ncbi:MAG: alpha/beta hydrolase [Hyphomicrobiales bacterium]|nr:alpha/beta hydrolase [Hyphomicrobiales bacterium]
MKLVETPDNPIPPGATVMAVETVDGLTLRAARFAPQGACRGTVLIASGRSEYIEKYFETISGLLARGLGVVVFDWRGQGLSTRELKDRAKGHIDDFSLYLRDLDAVRAQVLEPHCPKPWYALGHSMGGAILLDQAHDNGSPFARLVLSAPMIDLTGLRFPKLARALAVLCDSIGLGGAFVPGGGRKPVLERGFAGNPLTTNERRFNRIRDVLAAEPQLSLGDPTIAWAHAAFRQMQKFQDAEYPRQIRTPVLIFAAQHDWVVDSYATERFAARLKVGRMILLERSRHEILLENDAVRARFWAGFDAFIPGAAGEADMLLARHGKVA